MGRFAAMARAIGDLTDEKNDAYGDSFVQSGKIMGILYPHGISVDQMTDALGVVRVLDKLFRIATRKDAFAESPWKDISGYGLLGAVKDLIPANLPREVRDTVRPTGSEKVSLEPAIVSSNTAPDSEPDTLRSAKDTAPLPQPFLPGGVGVPSRFLRPEDIRREAFSLSGEDRYVVIHRDTSGKILAHQKAEDIEAAIRHMDTLQSLAFPSETVEIRNAGDQIVCKKLIQRDGS